MRFDKGALVTLVDADGGAACFGVGQWNAPCEGCGPDELEIWKGALCFFLMGGF